jgi:hypothetical protein
VQEERKNMLAVVSEARELRKTRVSMRTRGRTRKPTKVVLTPSTTVVAALL